MSDNANTRETVEETRTGYHVEVESKRGTGTRDQDKVRVECWTETEPEAEELARLSLKAEKLMNERRAHQPDTEGGDE
jgi:hypothetical protein